MASSQSTVNVKQQILNIIASSVPNEAKRTLIEYCCNHSLEILENETRHGLLKLAIEWIVCAEFDSLLIESGRMLLKTWAQNKTTTLASFFTESVLLTLLKLDDVQPSRILFILTCVFPHLKTSSEMYPKLCKLVSHEITTWLKRDDVKFVGSLASFLKDNSDCLEVGKDELLKVNIYLIQCLGKTKIPNASKEEMIEYFSEVQCICELLNIIWTKDSSRCFIMMSVKECFEILSSPNYPSTVALSSLTCYIADDVIISMMYEVTTSNTITDDVIYSGLSKMMQWLVWPKKTKVALWLLTFFKCLVKAGRKKLLQNLVLEKILQVFSRVFMPVVRESNFVVLVNMLMQCLDSPVVFHKIVPFVPNLMDRLRSEKKGQSNHYLTALGELMYTLMYRFPDSSGVAYSSLLLSLKDVPKPTSNMINKWLHSVNAVFPSEDSQTPSSSFIFTPEMLNLGERKGKTGLVNLGNTCYMNSVLQCLFMLDVFRYSLFTRRASLTRHPVMYSLQDVFTFLLLSKREAIAPENFVRHSRPPWFPARTQQDCCEFVHFLMDKLEEEDNSLLRDETETTTLTTNVVENQFKGILCVSYRCMSCGNESKHKEEFTDILLAFPEVPNVEKRDAFKTTKFPIQEESSKSLKGGDQVRSFQETKYKDGPFEATKETVSNVQTTPEPSPHVPAVVKQGADQRSTFSIEEMLDYFIKPEELSGNNQYFCDECHANVDAERRVQITKLPNFLVLSLKRFSFDVKSQTKPKLLHVVDYPEELNFCSIGESIKLAPKASCRYAEDDEAIKEAEAMDTSCSLLSYQLCSVVIHSGLTCEAGHYYSYALDTSRKTSSAGNSQWYCFNDETTYETSHKDFLEREKSSVTDTTYIMIYRTDELKTAKNNEHCDAEAPADMIERVRQDNVKYMQERSRYLAQGQTVDLPSTSDSNGKDDDSPPPGSCGPGDSNFSIPGNRFIF